MNTETKTPKMLKILLWTAQILLALTFTWAAGMKLFADPAKLAEMWPWTAENATLVKTTGVLDLLAGLGLIIPSLLRLPQLTVFAAIGTILLMIAAIVFHVNRGEASQIGFNVFVLLVTGFIIYGLRKQIAGENLRKIG